MMEAVPVSPSEERASIIEVLDGIKRKAKRLRDSLVCVSDSEAKNDPKNIGPVLDALALARDIEGVLERVIVLTEE